MERKSRAQTESLAFIFVVAVVLVLVNLLVFRSVIRWDLTKRQLFTLSDGTRRVVHGLHDQLTITVYWTSGQAPPWSDDERTLRDQLEEYRAAGGDRVVVRWVNPDNTDREHQADAAQCTKRALQTINEREQVASLQRAYRCIAFEYLGRRDKIAFLQAGVGGLEYDITSIIKKLTTPEGQRERTIGFLTGHGELTPDEGMQYLGQLMEQERVDYHTRAINLNNGDQDVPSDIKGLIIANPTRRIEERELRRLDAYLMHGGSIAVFAGGVNFPSFDPANANGSAAEHHLNDWLDGYGVHINTDVVFDRRSSDVIVPIEQTPVRLLLVTWPTVPGFPGEPTANDLRTQGGLDPAFAATFRLPEVIVPYSSTLAINDATRRTAGGDLHPFAYTSPLSVLRTSDFNIELLSLLQEPEASRMFNNPPTHGPYPVGVALTGRFRSAFAGHAPPPPAADAGVAPAAPPTVPERAEHDARLMVVSDAGLFSLDSLRTMVRLTNGRPGSIVLLFNTFDWLSQDVDLLAVRAKDTSDPPLRRDISGVKRQVFQWGAIAILPLAIGILGMAITSARRSRRKNYVRDFGTKPAASET
jgi:ABC-type uncharacterized transport system involved in gliding motility auxiliary subunit